MKLRRLAHDIIGGVAAAPVVLGQVLTLGVLVFASLGFGAVESGLRAAFAAAIFGNLAVARMNPATSS